MNGMISITYISLLLKVFVMVLLCIRLFRRLKDDPPSPVLVYLLFGVATLLVSDLYWTAFAFMTQGTALPFAAVEIAEAGAYLCFASFLRAALGDKIRTDHWALAVSVGLAACNTALWIAWTGSWAKDVLTGAAMCYLIYTCLRGTRRYRLLSRQVKIAFLAGSLGIFALQAGALALGGETGTLLDNLCAPLWTLGIFYFLIRSLRAVRGDAPGIEAMLLACTGFIWCLCSMFLSYEPFYFLPNAVSIVMIILTVLAAEKEVAGP